MVQPPSLVLHPRSPAAAMLAHRARRPPMPARVLWRSSPAAPAAGAPPRGVQPRSAPASRSARRSHVAAAPPSLLAVACSRAARAAAPLGQCVQPFRPCATASMVPCASVSAPSRGRRYRRTHLSGPRSRPRRGRRRCRGRPLGLRHRRWRSLGRRSHLSLGRHRPRRLSSSHPPLRRRRCCRRRRHRRPHRQLRRRSHHRGQESRLGRPRRRRRHRRSPGARRVGISGPTGDLGTAMAWLRPVALLQSSPPFGEWRGSGGKGPVLGWLLCSDAIPARSDEPEGGLTKPGRDGTCLRGTCMVQPRDARKIPLGGAQG